MKPRSIVVGLGLLLLVGVVIVVAVRMPELRQLQIFATEKSPAQQNADKIQQRPPALVKVATIQKRTVTPTQLIVGTVKPRRISKVGSAASGRVEKFLVNESEPVGAGQPIAILRTKTIEAEVEAANQAHLALKFEYQRLVNSLDEEINQAKANLSKNAFLLSFLTGKKNRAMLAGQAVSQEDLEEIISLENQAKSGKIELEAKLKLLRATKDAKLKEASAKEKGAAALKARLEDQLKRHTIVAPFDGFVVKEHTEAGEWVLQGSLVATIAELSEVEIEVPVLEDYVSYLKKGDKVSVEVPALPTGRNPFPGVIASIVPQANPKTQTFPVKVLVKNLFDSFSSQQKSPLLKAEMLARVQLPAGPTKTGAIMVPRDAVNLERGTKSVFVIAWDSKERQKSTARQVFVELGVSDGNWVEIFGDVQAGQEVVIEGNERLRPGQEVMVAKPQ